MVSINFWLKINKQMENVIGIIPISIFKLRFWTIVAQCLKFNKMVSFWIILSKKFLILDLVQNYFESLLGSKVFWIISWFKIILNHFLVQNYFESFLSSKALSRAFRLETFSVLLAVNFHLNSWLLSKNSGETSFENMYPDLKILEIRILSVPFAFLSFMIHSFWKMLEIMRIGGIQQSTFHNLASILPTVIIVQNYILKRNSKENRWFSFTN